MAVCESLVDIARGRLGRPELRLEGIEGRSAKTDLVTVYIGQSHPHPRLACKHELAHIYYGSDLEMRLATCLQIMVKITRMGELRVPPHRRERIVSGLLLFVNILDDVRVNSHWSAEYPGDGQQFEKIYTTEYGPRLAKEAEKKWGDNVPDLFVYAALLSLGQDAQSTTWGVYREAIVDSAEAVKLTTFRECLRLISDLLLDIAADLAKTRQNPILVMAEARSDIEYRIPEAGFNLDQTLRPGPAVSDKARDMLAGKMEPTAEEGSPRVVLPEDVWSIGNLSHDIEIVKIAPRDVFPFQMTMQDRDEASKWHSMFETVNRLRVERLDSTGDDLDVDAYLNQRHSGVPLECFYEDAQASGFRVILLVDASASMKAAYSQVERLVGMLTRAFRFGFVTTRVLVFQNKKAGVASVYAFPPDAEGLRATRLSVGGATPLPQALEAAKNLLLEANETDEVHIVVLTDGVPYFVGGSPLGPDKLLGRTKEAAQTLRESASVWCLQIGEHRLPDEMMDQLFPDAWQEVPATDFYQPCFEFFSTRFLHFLATR